MTPCLVFDLDGTLTDPAVGIGRCLDHALARFGHSPIEESQLSRYIGPPLDQTFAEITGSTLHVGELVRAFRERYSELGFAENQVYPGVAEGLRALAEAGWKLGVCTSKRVDFAERILRLFELEGFFQFVDGGDIGITKTDQLAALVRDGIVPEGSTMIGDRAVDVVAGRANLLWTVGVLWGHGSRAELVAAGAHRLWGSPLDMFELVAEPRTRGPHSTTQPG